MKKKASSITYSKTSLNMLEMVEFKKSMSDKINALIIGLLLSVVSSLSTEAIEIREYSLDECIKIVKNSLKAKKIKEELEAAQYAYEKILKELWGSKVSLNITPKNYKFYDQPIVLQEEVQLSEAEANEYKASEAQKGVLSITKLIPTGGMFTIEGRIDRDILKGKLAGLDASYESFQRPEIKLNFNQPLFLFKKNPYKRRMNEALSYLNIANYDFNISTEDIVYQVKERYFSCLLASEKVNIAKETLEFTQGLQTITLANFNAGKISKIDLIQIEIQLEEAKELLLSRIDDYKIECKRLKSIIGCPDEIEIKLTDKLDLSPFQEIDVNEMVSSLNNFYEIKKKEEMIKLAEIELERIKEKNKPNISLNIDYGYQDKEIKGEMHSITRSSRKKSNQWEVSLNLYYPIFDSGKIDTEIKEYEAKIVKLRYELLIEKEKILLYIQEIANRIKKAKREITSLNKRIEQAESSLDIANLRYKEGIGTLLEVLHSQNLNSNLNLKKKEAIFNLLIAMAELEKIKVIREQR